MDEIKSNIEEELRKLVRSTKRINILRTKELALEKEINKKRKKPSDSMRI